MSDGWVCIPRPARHATWVHYDHGVELRVQPIVGERFEVALLRRVGPMAPDGPTDVFVRVVNGMKAACRVVRWVKENVEALLDGEVAAHGRAARGGREMILE